MSVPIVGARARLVAVVMSLALAAAATGCGSSARTGATGRFTPAHPGVLTVATAFFPAPGFWEGRPAAPTGGLEWDLARALAGRFGLGSVSVVPVAFGDLVAGHLSGADLALSQLTPTDERRKHLAFSTPYLVAPPGVVVRPGTDTPDLAALQKLRWVAVTGSTLTTVVRERIRPENGVLAVESRRDALAAIDARVADAMLLDLPVGLALARALPRLYDVPAQLSGPEGLAAALPADSSNFDAVDTAMRAFGADGTIDRLSKRWLGAEIAGGDEGLPLIRTEQ